MGRGIDPQVVFENAGIEFNCDQEYSKPLTPREITSLFNVAAQTTSDEYFGMRMGGNFKYESAGLTILNLVSASNLEQGLTDLIKYGKYVDNGLDQKLIRGSESFIYQLNICSNDDLDWRQFNEYLLSLILCIISTCTQQDIHPESVAFPHQQHAPMATYLEFYGSKKVLFNRENLEICLPNQVLSLPFVSANKLLHSMIVNSLKSYISEELNSEFSDIVCRELMRMTAKEIPSINSVASNLSVSTRTLRRKLMHEGHTFQEMKHLAMEKKAKHLLASTNLSIAEIAYELGYSEVSAFSRAFRSWTLDTPQHYRNSLSQ
nr:AraC family transcriptional regulator [Aestuariicella albida]